MRHVYHDRNGEEVRVLEMQRVLCFEYMHGGSLDKHISEKSCDLDWPTCYKIIKGTCEGLNHLHNENAKPILHLDLKPHNILLDKDMTAKIADLGLSKLVASSETLKTETRTGTLGYMPPEFVEHGYFSKKFDVFSFGVIILKIMAGNKGYFGHSGKPPDQFIKRVTKNWKERLQGTSRYSSQEIDILQVETCIGIALRCVEADRKKRPRIKEIVAELEQLESQIQIMKMSVYSDQVKDLIGQGSSGSNILGVDPSHELRFPLEIGKDISCCLQLTNKTDGFVAYNTKINKQSKYCTKPSKGIMEPYSKCYITVTLQNQEVAPLNMECHDMFLVQSVKVSKGMTPDNITEDYFKKAMMVDVIQLPIVYVTMDL